MSVTNINNNTAQLYTQEKPATTSLKQPNNQSAATSAAPTTDSVQISERAKELLARESLGNGGGIIPPGNITGSEGKINTQGNGGGIIPPGNAPASADGSEIRTQGNGGGIIPPGN